MGANRGRMPAGFDALVGFICGKKKAQKLPNQIANQIEPGPLFE
jgi:hypothetical protein